MQKCTAICSIATKVVLFCGIDCWCPLCWKSSLLVLLCSHSPAFSNLLTAYIIPVNFDFLISSLARRCKSSSKSGRSFCHDETTVPGFTEDPAQDTLYMVCSSYFFSQNAVVLSSLTEFSEGQPDNSISRLQSLVCPWAVIAVALGWETWQW